MDETKIWDLDYRWSQEVKALKMTNSKQVLIPEVLGGSTRWYLCQEDLTLKPIFEEFCGRMS